MAETRKFQPSNSAVGDAVRAALGEPVRPVQPGSLPEPSQPAAASAPPTAKVAVHSFTFGAVRRPVASAEADTDD